MKILFVDETDKQANAQSGEFFCLCGGSVEEEHLIAVGNALDAIKTKYGLVNFKDARKSGLAEDVRLAIAREIFECLSNYGVKIRAIVLGNSSMSARLPKEDIYMGAMSFLLERFTLCLLNEHDTGMVVFDTVDHTLERELRKRFYKYIQEEVLTMRMKPLALHRDFIHPSLLFSDDNHSVLIQAVDLIATSLNGAIFSCKKTDAIIVSDLPTKNKFLEIYWPLFVTSPSGTVSGWGLKIWD